MAKGFATFAADDPVLPLHMQRLRTAANAALSGNPAAKPGLPRC